MSDLAFYCLSPDGRTYENKDILPSSALALLHGEDGPFFRFAYDPSANRLYVQDESFRGGLATGDKDCWDKLNQALFFLENKHGARFLERAFGEPPGSDVVRKLSQYQKAWSRLCRFLGEELGASPVDASVLEYVPEASRQPEEAIDLALDGTQWGVKGPILRLNRMLNKAWKTTGKVLEDVDYDLMNEALEAFYLVNIDKIADAFPQSGLKDKLSAARRGPGAEFFATRSGPAVRIFKCQNENEATIREKTQEAGPIALFSLDKSKKRLNFHNHPPNFMAGNDKDLLDGIRERVAKSLAIIPHGLILTFDPGLSRPFVSRMSRYPELWDVIEGMGYEKQDACVVEAPLSPSSGAAALVRSPKEEETKAPGMGRLRSLNGIPAKYPFIMVDNRQSRGRRLRGMLDQYLDLVGEGKDELDTLKGREFLEAIRQPAARERTRSLMAQLSSLGMTKRHVLDFFSGPEDLLKRAEYRAIMEEANSRPVLATRNASRKTADLGPELGINDWWYFGLQESLNQAQHDENKGQPKARPSKPFNLRKKRQPPTTEELLDPKRDKNMSAQKSMEQLLRESLV